MPATTPVGFAEWDGVTAGRDLSEEILAEEARLDELTRRRNDSHRRLNELRAAQDNSGEVGASRAATSSDSWPPERKL
ncbi:MAG: hypothetical protein WCD85_21235, partial [Pantoea agglomerans]